MTFFSPFFEIGLQAALLCSDRNFFPPDEIRHLLDLRSDFIHCLIIIVLAHSPISDRGDVRSQKQWEKGQKISPKPETVEKEEKHVALKSVGTLVRLLWREAAQGLKPLRLPRAKNCGHVRDVVDF